MENEWEINVSRNCSCRPGRKPSIRERFMKTINRIEPWKGTKRLLKSILRFYVRPKTLEERVRDLGVRIGKDVQLQPFTLDERYARLLAIEDNASIGKGTTIYLSDSTLNTAHTGPNPPPALFGPVRIGKGAAVGRNVIILSGVTIGENSIVGAGSLVTRDIPPNSVAAGSPARVICSVKQLEENRFSEKTIRKDKENIYIYMPNWRRRKRIGMSPEEQDLYYEENFPKRGFK